MMDNSKTWADMTDRERDAALEARLYPEWAEGRWRMIEAGTVDRHPDLVPHYTTHFVARPVEDEIERRNLQERYIQELDKLVTYERDQGWEWFRWGIMRATPAQRCEAAWRTLGGT